LDFAALYRYRFDIVFNLDINQPDQWALKIQDCCGEIEQATAVVATPFSSR
jgi:hypothetical protein